MLLTVLSAIFVFGLIVLVHEFGHFITAKMTGMRVDEFAIGFGPKILSFKRGETVYSIRAIPLGGFNDIAGMDPTNNEAGERGYCEKPVLSRMIVILAGSVMNFILPIFLFFSVFFFVGVTEPAPGPLIGAVVEGNPADIAGLKAGDKISAVNGTAVNSWNEFIVIMEKAQVEQPLKITYERDGQAAETELTPIAEKNSGRAIIGVQTALVTIYPGLFESIQLAIKRVIDVISFMISALIDIFQSPSSAELAGPLGIAQMTGQVAQKGFAALLNFAALLSLNLGIINLLPLPALDGGHFVTLALEAVRGKPLSPKALIYTQKVGVVLLLLLMIFATKNDIVRIFLSD